MRLSGNGGCPAVGAECNDFRELRKELFRLRERQQLIEAAFESAYEGIVLVDPDGKIVMLNDTYAKFLQVDAREVIGRHVTEVIENTRMHNCRPHRPAGAGASPTDPRRRHVGSSHSHPQKQPGGICSWQSFVSRCE